MSELNTRVRFRVRSSQLQSVPVDNTLSIEGQAADAAAVGAALAQKADLSQVTGIKVNGQAADQQGLIYVDGSDIPVSGEDSTLISAKIAALDAKTAANIPMSAESGAQSIADAINGSVNRAADAIPLEDGSTTMVKDAIEGLQGDTEDLQEDVEGLQTDVGAIQGWTAENVPYTAGTGAPSVKAKIDGLEARTAADIPYDTGSEDSVKDMLDDLADGRVKTVNGEEADAEGNVQLDVVPYADDLRTEDSVQIDAPFVVRTAGGAASIKTGDAQIRKLKGNSVHTGYVAEILEMDTELMEGSQITVALDPDVFRAYVQTSAVIAMIYSTDWKIGAETVDPADYGITVTGTPEAGDMITVTYVPEERGTITPADPEELHSTGWNLFDYSNGYARVAAYGGLYKVGGSYSTIRFATDPAGTSSPVVVDENGLFAVEEDGYILITGGNNTNTYIICCWSDWESGPTGAFEEYDESVIDLSTIMQSLPNGLCSVGAVYDEINFTTKQIIPRVKRITYSEAARAEAEASGLSYDFDEDYIYIEMTAQEIAAATSSFSLENQYAADEHGIEFFTGTLVAVGTEIAYGSSLKDKLRRDVLTISQQSLNSTQQKQARANIRAAAADDVTAINNKLNGLLKYVYYSYTWTGLAAGSIKHIKASDFGISTPSGYEVLGIGRFSSGTVNCPVANVYPFATGTTTAMSIINASGATQNNKNASIGIIYVRKGIKA